ncbi:hypothetical protein [Methylobacterium crusticola]|uniref:hypothetical protein n=1 Tax=Methylobacterium crusticola TaxID=1697972 RepID=UPI001FD3CF12|nr:hypothetical protein [Methylobacterium crusticola]
MSPGTGGLDRYMIGNRNALKTANVFAGLFTVFPIGRFVENVIFSDIEKTIRRWGMRH